MVFKNSSLQRDIDEIMFDEPPITIAKSYDVNFAYPFGIDIEHTTYWYANEVDRDSDYQQLKSKLTNFSFID